MNNREPIDNPAQPDRQERFLDTKTGLEMSREDFIQRIQAGEYPGYYIAASNGKEIAGAGADEELTGLD